MIVGTFQSMIDPGCLKCLILGDQVATTGLEPMLSMDNRPIYEYSTNLENMKKFPVPIIVD